MNCQMRESKTGFRLSFTYNRSIPVWGRGAPFVPAPRYKHVDDYICTEMHWKVQRTQRSQMCMIQCVIHTHMFVQIKWTMVASASRFRMNALWVNSGAFLLWKVVQLPDSIIWDRILYSIKRSNLKHSVYTVERAAVQLRSRQLFCIRTSSPL